MKKTIISIMSIVLVFLLFSANNAMPGVLDGQSGTLYYYFPNVGSTFSSDSFTAPSTILTLTYGPDLVNTIGGDNINITFGNIGYSFTPGTFNGEWFNFPSLLISSVDYTSNFTTDWGWDANDVWVNWQGLTPDAGSYVNFNISSSAVPEPATMLLVASGLIGLAGYGRRRFKK